MEVSDSTGVEEIYTYDANGNVTQILLPDGGTITYTYDAEELRSQMEENGKLVSFIYTDREVIAEEDEAGAHIRYIRGHELLASDSAHARTYYHYACDEMGSITDITDTNGTVLNHYAYDAFGNRTVEEETVENRFGFAGEMMDAVTGQYYLRARFYNPVIARFLSEDTYYGDGLNLYAYCHNNPVGYVDPSGHEGLICSKKYGELKKKEAGGGTLSEIERQQIYEYEQNQKKSSGAGSGSKSGDSSRIRVDSYDNMRNDSNVTGQAHHLSQNAVFKNAISQGDGLCVELNGNAFSEIGSPHYEVHRSLERFWNQYRKGGDLYREYPTIGEYNRAVYNSLLSTNKFTPQEAAYAVRRAYGQQRSAGFTNSDFVPRIPGKLPQKK